MSSSKRGVKSTRRRAAKRELIEPTPGDKRYVRRDRAGRFKEVEDVGRSLSQDRRRRAKRKSHPGVWSWMGSLPPGQGRGRRPPRMGDTAGVDR
jgi:hypothetical protein